MATLQYCYRFVSSFLIMTIFVSIVKTYLEKYVYNIPTYLPTQLLESWVAGGETQTF